MHTYVKLHTTNVIRKHKAHSHEQQTNCMTFVEARKQGGGGMGKW